MGNYLPEQASSNAGESMQIAQDIVKANTGDTCWALPQGVQVGLGGTQWFHGEWVVSVYHEERQDKRKGSQSVSTLDSVKPPSML